MEFKIIQNLVLEDEHIHTTKFLITNISLLLQLTSSQTLKLEQGKKKVFPESSSIPFKISIVKMAAILLGYTLPESW